MTQEKKTVPTAATKSLDQVIETITQLRIDSARVAGQTQEQYTNLMRAVEKFDGLFGRMAAGEKDIALLRERADNFEDRMSSWRETSESDRATLRKDVQQLQEFRWTLLGIIIGGQVVFSLFGPAIRLALHLP